MLLTVENSLVSVDVHAQTHVRGEREREKGKGERKKKEQGMNGTERAHIGCRRRCIQGWKVGGTK